MVGAIERGPFRLHVAVALLASLVGCQSTTQPPVAPESIDPLPTEEPVERKITGGVTHVYELTVRSGEYFSADVEQLGVDLVATWRGPDGAELLRVDNLTGSTGNESVFALGRTSGTHRLEVKTYRDFEAGRYRIVGTKPGAPSEPERILAEAAELQYRPPTSPPDSSELKLGRLRKALGLWLSVSARRQAALTLQRLGSLQPPEMKKAAKDCLLQALDLMETAGCGGETAPLWNSLAQLSRDLAPVEQVDRFLSRALETARAAGDRNEEAVALNGFALGSKAKGQPWEALSYFEQTLKIWAELGNKVSEATAHFNIGSLYGLLGKLPDSADAYQHALDLYRLTDRKMSQADVLAAMAGAHIEEGELGQAEEELRQSLELIRQLESKLGAGVERIQVLRIKYLDRLGTVLLKRGQPAEAASNFESAIALAHKISSRVLQAVVLNDLGTLHDQCGDPARALEKHEAALAIFGEMGERIGASYSQSLIARSKLHLGDLLGAKSAIETALSATESVRFASKNPDFRSSYFASIRDRVELDIEILMALHSREPNRGYDIQAFEESERGRARSLLDLLSETRGRRRLVEGTEENRQALTNQINTVQNQLDRLEPRPPGVDDAELEKRLSKLMLKLDLLRTRSDLADGATEQWTSTLALPEIQRQVLDDDTTLLLSYSLGDERSYLTVVSHRDLASYELPGRQTIESAARQFLYCLSESRSLSARAQLIHSARGLGKLLLGPIASRLTDQRLLIVSEGALQYIPFAALELPRSDPSTPSSEPNPLVLDHEIVNVPSASILAALRKRASSRQPARKLVAVFADPVFEPDDPRFAEDRDSNPVAVGLQRAVDPVEGLSFRRLPWSLREAKAILELVPPKQRFQALGFEATRELVTESDLRDYRILHFATHGHINGNYPELSFVVLSRYDRQGGPRYGLVRMHEIPDLDLPAELVVLSACSTALGKAVPGEGLVGLTQAFLSAGAARLVVSLWDVNDRGTADLMTNFYRGMLNEGLSPAAALRAAQLVMIADPKWSAPYYWAPFVIEGEWRGID